MKPKCEII